LVNVLSRQQQTWPHITQSEPSAVVSEATVSKRHPSTQAVGYNDAQFLNSLTGIGFGYRAEPGGWTQNPNQLALPVPSPVVIGNAGTGLGIITDPVGASDRHGNLYFTYVLSQLSFFCTVYGCAIGQDSRIGMSASTSLNDPSNYSNAETAIDATANVIHDKDWFTIDRKGTQYLCWTDIVTLSDTQFTSQIWFARRLALPPHKFDAAVPVSAQLSYPAVAQGCQVAVGKDGSIYVAWWQGTDLADDEAILGARTVDGVNFGPTFAATPPFIQPYDASATADCRTTALKGHIRVEPFPSLAIDQQNGAVYIAYTRATATGGSEIAFVRSADKGATWSLPLVVNDSPVGDKFMPAVAHSKQLGAIKIIWYDRRNDPDNLNVDVYGAISSDGGGSFGANARLTTAAFGVPRLFPNFDCVAGDLFAVFDCYMGDYIALTSYDHRGSPPQHGGYVHAWGDNSLKFHDPDDDLDVPDPDVRAFVGC